MIFEIRRLLQGKANAIRVVVCGRIRILDATVLPLEFKAITSQHPYWKYEDENAQKNAFLLIIDDEEI